MLVLDNSILQGLGDAGAYFDRTLRYAIRPTEVAARTPPQRICHSLGWKDKGREAKRTSASWPLFIEPPLISR